MYGIVKNGEIQEFKRTLPGFFEGTAIGKNITKEKLLELGIYKVIGNSPTLEDWQKYGKATYNIKTDHIEEVKEVIDIDLSEYKEKKKKEIKQKLHKKRLEGCNTSVAKIDCMQENVTDWQGNYQTMKLNNLSETTIRDYDNVRKTITFDEYETMINELYNHISGLYNKKWQMDEDIDALDNHEDIYNYNISY